MTIEILTGLLVLITTFYAWATYKILKANERVVEVMKEQSEAVLRPYITVTPFLRKNEPVFALSIKNTGKMPALNVRLKLNKDFYSFGDKERNIAEFPAFTNTIDSFAPNEELLFTLDIATRLFGEDDSGTINPQQFTIIVKYNFGDRKVKEEHSIDLRSYLSTERQSDIHATKLEGIQKEIKNLSAVIKDKYS